jgi:hypothetical protein
MFNLNIGKRGLQSDDDVLLMPACTNKVTPPPRDEQQDARH